MSCTARLFLIAASLLASAETVAAASVAARCETIQILSDQLSAREAEDYCGYALIERRKVERYWGATWAQPIRIHVDDAYRISRALVVGFRGDRGLMEMPLARVRRNDGALLHEIVHIYAPNDNRFLAEGLAVYLHHKLAANAAFPDFGRPLAAAARARLAEIPTLVRLDAVRTPTPLSSVADQRSAYLAAGSFVAFLIESFGLADFKKLYDGAPYDAVYGKPLEALETAWRATLN